MHRRRGMHDRIARLDFDGHGIGVLFVVVGQGIGERFIPLVGAPFVVQAAVVEIDTVERYPQGDAGVDAGVDAG